MTIMFRMDYRIRNITRWSSLHHILLTGDLENENSHPGETECWPGPDCMWLGC